MTTVMTEEKFTTLGQSVLEKSICSKENIIIHKERAFLGNLTNIHWLTAPCLILGSIINTIYRYQ
jgi:hypothetical protein